MSNFLETKKTKGADKIFTILFTGTPYKKQSIHRGKVEQVIETTIKDTLQTLLDSDEMHPKVCMEVNNEQKARDEAFEIEGYNNAITAIRNKITSMLEDNN